MGKQLEARTSGSNQTARGKCIIQTFTAKAKKLTLVADLHGDTKEWSKKAVSTWRPLDVMHWITWIADENKFPYEEVSMHNFNETGIALLALTEQDFVARDQEYGKFLFDQLQTVRAREGEKKGIKRRRGRPLGSSSGRSKPKGNKRCRLWEFLLRLLASTEHSPSVIEWDDYKTGLFRINQPNLLAELWGTFRGKTNMDYVKLSRLMRYYYKNGELESVKQRLVYRFGPKASDWRTVKVLPL